MTAPLTVSIDDAAKALGAPKTVVQQVANDLGLLICFGSRKRIDPNDYQDIMDACRSTPKAPAYIAAPTQASISSETPEASKSQRAHETAQKLKES